MKEVLPHEVFSFDFNMILEEGKRQEQTNSNNQGEYDLVKSIHTYFSSEILPLIAQDDWVFQAASELATKYIDAYFQCI